MDNLTIFDLMYEDFKITKPIRLIEMFAGYGSQAFALKYLGVPFEHWRICEWAVPSIQAYKDAHFTNDNVDYSKCFTKEGLIECLYNNGISMDYNQPMKLEQIKRMSEEQLRTIYNNIVTTNNLVNIQKTKGRDLDIVEQDKYTYVLTYSFPCQDLSLAGKGKGMSRDSGTRSGMLWEVERILDECNSLNCLPQVLLMENVPQVIGEKNLNDFIMWRGKLESLGYSNYVQILNAKDYGIPQNRQRCFMVSILGDYNYNFPKKIPLELKLKDMLEKNVDEKYYLSDKMIQGMIDTNFESYKLENKLLDEYGCANTIIARFEGTPQCIEVKENFVGTYEYSKSDNFMQGKDRFYKNKEVSNTLLASGNHNGIMLNNLRIRKLTPKECFRLMGVKDEDYENIAKNQSNSKLYHLAGDSIPINLLMALFDQMIGKGWENIWNILINKNK